MLEKPVPVPRNEPRGYTHWQAKKENPRTDKNKIQVLVIEKRVPTYDRDAGSLRLYWILKLLTELNYKVTFLPDEKAHTFKHLRKLQEMGVDVPLHVDNINFLQKSGPLFSVVILSRPDEALKYYPYVSAYAVNSKIIFDTVDAHWVRFKRAFQLYRHEYYRERWKYYRAIEGISARCSDLVLTVTENDKCFFEELAPGLKTEVLPSIHNVVKPQKDFKDRKNLMFIGGFYHHPNVDAVIYFAKKVFPLITKKLRDADFIIVGSNPPDSVKRLNSANIKVTGFVDDVSPYFESCRVFVSPLRYGAGMKGKIAQSMAHGLPVVTTSMGAEGMGITDGQNALVADHPEKFAEAAARLYTDEQLWKDISFNSLKHIEKNFSPEIIRLKLERIISSLLSGKILPLEEIRRTEPEFYKTIATAQRLGAYASLRREAGLGLDQGIRELLNVAQKN